VEELLLFLLHGLARLLLELLSSSFFDVFGDVLFEAIVGTVRRALTEPFLTSAIANPLWAGTGLLIMGGLAGALATLLFPTPLIARVLLPGSSLVIMPPIIGWMTRRCGRMLERHGQPGWFIASNAGGQCFGFALVAVRFLLVSHGV
jgi:hypothetical protein